MPTSSRQRDTRAGGSSMSTPSVSTTSAEPRGEDTDRLRCLATLSPAPATTKAVAVETLKVPDASPPVPHVSMSISRSVPVCATTGLPWARTVTTFCRITCANPISSSTVSPFMRIAVRKAAICASVAAPDMTASMAAAASIRVRSRRSTSARTASVMIGLVMGVLRLLAAPRTRQRDGAVDVEQPEWLGQHQIHAVRAQVLGRDLDTEAADDDDAGGGRDVLDRARDLPSRHARHRQIGHHEVEPVGAEARDRLAPAACHVHALSHRE